MRIYFHSVLKMTLLYIPLMIISSLKRYGILFDKVVDASHDEKFAASLPRIFIMLKNTKQKSIGAVPFLIVFCLVVSSSVVEEER